jgi:hypothetical protein
MRQIRLLTIFLLLTGLAAWAQTRTIGEGTEIKVRTDNAIPAHPTSGAAYTATVSDDVPGTGGNIAIPRGSRARLVAVPTNDGKDTVLDLRSVSVSGRRYDLAAAGGGKSTGSSGLGANTRTAKYVGGGAAVGAVLGALLGGGKGAAIGALAGGGAGAGAQVLTGKKKGIPAETQLSYKLAQPLTMRPVAARSSGLQKRPAKQQ